METARIQYRKLPGRRRGFVFGSSVWLGPDHLLLVKSWRFREEYKRFYFRDIQAIVTAAAPRFHFSTRSATLGLLWLFVLALSVGRSLQPLEWTAGVLGLALIGAWVYLSGFQSCRCRIYTAVSSDELRSLYRLSTAARFLEKVAPLLAEAQGALSSEAAEALDARDVGPLPEGRIGLGAAGPAELPPRPVPPPVRTPLSMLFVGVLCLGGAAELASFGAAPTVARWILAGFLVLQLGAAVAVIIENYVGKGRASLRNLAIVTAIAIGGWYYAVQVGAGIAIAYRNADRQRRHEPISPEMSQLVAFDYAAARETAAGIALLAGLAGALLLARGERPVEEKVSFNV
jgi:hypothetical protein